MNTWENQISISTASNAVEYGKIKWLLLHLMYWNKVYKGNLN